MLLKSTAKTKDELRFKFQSENVLWPSSSLILCFEAFNVMLKEYIHLLFSRNFYIQVIISFNNVRKLFPSFFGRNKNTFLGLFLSTSITIATPPIRRLSWRCQPRRQCDLPCHETPQSDCFSPKSILEVTCNRNEDVLMTINLLGVWTGFTDSP